MNIHRHVRTYLLLAAQNDAQAASRILPYLHLASSVLEVHGVAGRKTPILPKI